MEAGALTVSDVWFTLQKQQGEEITSQEIINMICGPQCHFCSCPLPLANRNVKMSRQGRLFQYRSAWVSPPHFITAYTLNPNACFICLPSATQHYVPLYIMDTHTTMPACTFILLQSCPKAFTTIKIVHYNLQNN